MNSTSYTDSIDLDPSKPFLCLLLEFPYYTAGDRITGEILMNLPESMENSNLILYASGYEALNVTTKHDKTMIYKNEIFHVATPIYTWENSTPQGQYNFPFTFKLPYFSPASFDINTPDQDGNMLQASVSYEIKIELDNKGDIVMKDVISLLIFNNKNRCTIPPNPSETELSTCCCFKKGHCNISLSKYSCENPCYGDSVKFKLELDWFNSKGQITEVFGKIVYKLQLSIPGDKTYEFTYELCEFKHTNSFITEANCVQTNYEFDVIIGAEFAENASSNATAMINSIYIGEATVIFNLGLSKRIAKATLPVHVNPKMIEGRNFNVPKDWEPSPSSIFNVYLQSRSGHPIFSPTKSSMILAKE